MIDTPEPAHDALSAALRDASIRCDEWTGLQAWLRARAHMTDGDPEARSRELSIWTVTHEHLVALTPEQRARVHAAMLAVGDTTSQLARRDRPGDPHALEPHVRALTELLGESDPLTLEAASAHGRCLRASGRPLDALPVLQSVLAHREDLLGPSHPSTLWSAENVGRCLMSLGRLREAEPLLELAARGFRVSEPADPLARIVSASHLADLRMEQGRLDESESLLRTALADATPQPRTERAHLWARCTLARVLVEQGRRLDADSMLRDVLAQQRARLREDDPDTLRTLGQLGRVARHLGHIQESTELLKDARARTLRAIGPLHRDTIWATSNLGATLSESGEHERATELAHEAWRSANESPWLGPAHQDTWILESRFAQTLLHAGERVDAESHASSSVKGLDAILGSDHVDSMRARVVLARTIAPADAAQARDMLARALERAYDDAAPRLPSLTEEEKRAHLRERARSLSELTSLCFRMGDAGSARVALGAILTSKDLRTDAARNELAAFRAGASPAERALFSTILDERRALSALVLARQGCTDETRDATLLSEIARVQRSLQARASALRDSTLRFSPDAVVPRPTPEQIASSLATDHALVEYVLIAPDANSNAREYGAVILRHGQDADAQCAVLRLGDADRVDALVQKFRRRMESGGRRDAFDEDRIAPVLAELRMLLWDPIQHELRGASRVYIAPDAQLHHLPFDALARESPDVQPRWTYLIETGPELVYVASGRDLLRFGSKAPLPARPPDAPIILLADPDFGPPQPRPASMLQVPTYWASVPETGEFVRGIAEALRHRVHAPIIQLLGADATQQSVLIAPQPRALVIATHGWFRASSLEDSPADDPLLHSMLLLSGANQPADPLASTDDGRLTAYELMGATDLSTCDMVVLVACRSALGAPSDEGGVNGLRRALSVNGARRVVLSMFDVPVRETIDLMDAFHANWLPDARPRSCYQSFRAAQKQLLQSARVRRSSGHPFWWSGFIFIGDPGDVPPERNDERPPQP
jgi:CHAT domain-containing protein